MLLVEEITPPFNPFNVFHLFKDDPYSFFLDSSISQKFESRYSFIGSNPFLILRSKGDQIEIIRDNIKESLVGNPFNIMEKLLEEQSIGCFSHLPPFVSGGVGYLAYDLRHLLEDGTSYAIDDIECPDCYIAFYDAVVAFDHYLKKMYLFSSGLPEKGIAANTKAKAQLHNLREKLASVSNIPIHHRKSLSKKALPLNHFNANFTRECYITAINKVKEYIALGDVYQVNLSQRFSTRTSISSFELYKSLREINPAPFAAYLNFDDVVVISSSPERFLHFSNETRLVQTRPIKGTRRRGETMIEDIRLAKELLTSKKDRAELIMIIDLERNDLGRVCEFGSVSVPKLICLEKHPTVYHLVSTIKGRLSKDKSCIDLLRSCFPGGSITGAPKIRAMKIIDELEPTKRSIYTGSIGYFSFTGNMDLNIAIRTFIVKGDNVYLQVGGGIVADSDPENEYYETLDKGRALMEALNYGLL